jgi:transcription-repair coupling factor (superfamily II helicase)
MARPVALSTDLTRRLKAGAALKLSGVADGAEALVAGDLARAVQAGAHAPPVSVLLIARDGPRMQALMRGLSFFAPDAVVLPFPAWDCQPYDRVSPNAAIVAERMTTLSRLSRIRPGERPVLVVTTVNAVTQRVPKREVVAMQSLSAAPGHALDLRSIADWLERNGYLRTATVRDTAEYAVRGGIVDLFPPGMDRPIRLDFFGDTLESIRAFDPETQRTSAQLRALDLVPAREFQMVTETMARFRQGYLAAFGAQTRGDMLYEAVSEGRRHPGMEHWLPLFHDGLETLFDYLPGTPVVMEPLADQATTARFEQIADYHDARRQIFDAEGQAAPYKPLPPDALYLSPGEWTKTLASRALASLSPFVPGDDGGVDVGTRSGRSFAAERAGGSANVFDAVVAHVRARQAAGLHVAIASWTEGSRERMASLLADHGLQAQRPVAAWQDVTSAGRHEVSLAVLGLESGFETADICVVSEQDILGDRLARPRRTAKRAQDFIAEVTSLAPGDLVVHVDHGIGRFIGLKSVTAAGAPHDCLEIHYAAGSRLLLPVENIELLSRYGSEDTAVELDRLGGAGWQQRKARMKNRIREIAHELIKVAAERQLREAPKLVPQMGLYDEFCAGFPYVETEDQDASINAVLGDLSAGRPMDRLICGDVGFGKTEVALRAAFAVALSGKQVAVVVPTTLLARQHFRNFAARFKGFPVHVAQASRLVASADLAKVKAGLADGTIDIVVGTHALLGKAISFKDLGLIIVDEEQHFGVAHKEKLKKLRAEVHVLTLSATPIPRTLQLAMTGVRDLSIIASPPVDRLAVRTFIAPFDALTIREALLRERYRGGQSFFVCPRIEDLGEIRDFLAKQVPEVKVAMAHGQLSATALEEVMEAFYEGKFDVLLSTAIVESGLDIPTANTLIVHRADMFGLAQLYQLRGRVGRSKTRAYALFTTPAERAVTAQAEQRLRVLQSLDTLGAGFQLASHDLDMRGAGNLLGDEQSGHIKEVGYELYQQMLEEAITALKAGFVEPVQDRWSPSITLGTPVLIPDDYVADLHVRLSIYRRLADVDEEREVDAFAAEFVDRFGKLPAEVDHLLKTVAIKALCRKANVEKIDAGAKGMVLSFRDNAFADPAGLVGFIRDQGPMAKVRPDMKVVFLEDWTSITRRLKGVTGVLRRLAEIAQKAQAKAA